MFGPFDRPVMELPDPYQRSWAEEQEWEREVAPLLRGELPASLQQKSKGKIQAATTEQRSGNELRPVSFKDIIGQEEAKRVLTRMVESAKRRERPLEHALFIGPSGTGKTTFANACAHEMERKVIQLEAPIPADTLLELSEVMEDGDILFVDEIHQQAVQDRRGRSSNTQPEVLFSVLEDFTLPTSEGVVQFPRITIFGATTDPGLLPAPFLNRFPIRPRLKRYTTDEMKLIARRNAQALGIWLGLSGARVFAEASRGVPREVNNYMRLAASLSEDSFVGEELALEVLDFLGVTPDGLTREMTDTLVFLYTRARRENKDGEVRYQASVSSIATALGLSRDQKAVQLHVEPELIQRGLLQVAHGGRVLTDAGILRAVELCEE